MPASGYDSPGREQGLTTISFSSDSGHLIFSRYQENLSRRMTDILKIIKCLCMAYF